jgi:DNA-binding transcriptional ArsR family regulator
MNRVFKALADPTRRRILQLLRQGPLGAGELAGHFDVSKPTMSAHFAVLQEADLVAAERQGRMILYRLKLSVLEDALLSFAQTVGSDVVAAARPRRAAQHGTPTRRPLRGTT